MKTNIKGGIIGAIIYLGISFLTILLYFLEDIDSSILLIIPYNFKQLFFFAHFFGSFLASFINLNLGLTISIALNFIFNLLFYFLIGNFIGKYFKKEIKPTKKGAIIGATLGGIFILIMGFFLTISTLDGRDYNTNTSHFLKKFFLPLPSVPFSIIFSFVFYIAIGYLLGALVVYLSLKFKKRQLNYSKHL